jgi:hypothetical protein
VKARAAAARGISCRRTQEHNAGTRKCGERTTRQFTHWSPLIGLDVIEAARAAMHKMARMFIDFSPKFVSNFVQSLQVSNKQHIPEKPSSVLLVLAPRRLFVDGFDRLFDRRRRDAKVAGVRLTQVEDQVHCAGN